jgi:DNA-binding FadR family transcriptional regulator
VLERLAVSADEDGIRGIRDAVDRLAEVITDGPDAVAEADLGVLAAILDATKSPVLRLCLNPVLTVVTSMPDLRAAIYAEPEGNLLAWRALVAWLAASRDPALVDDIVAELARRDLVTLSRLRSSHA